MSCSTGSAGESIESILAHFLEYFDCTDTKEFKCKNISQTSPRIKKSRCFQIEIIERSFLENLTSHFLITQHFAQIWSSEKKPWIHLAKSSWMIRISHDFGTTRCCIALYIWWIIRLQPKRIERRDRYQSFVQYVESFIYYFIIKSLDWLTCWFKMTYTIVRISLWFLVVDAKFWN